MTTIPLASPLLARSSNRPGDSRTGRPDSVVTDALPRRVAERPPIWSCSVRGFACRPCYHERGALLPHLFTLTHLRSPTPCGAARFVGRYVFCATVLQVALTGRYPAHCPAEFGLSSLYLRARRCGLALRRTAVVWLAAKTQLYTLGSGLRVAHARPTRPTRPPDLPDLPDLPVRLLADLVLLQLLVQIAARRTDDLGGLRDVPAVLPQLADQEHAFGVFLEFAERPQLHVGGVAAALRRRKRCGTARGGRRPDALGQVGQIDRVAAGHDDQPLDGVAQLADVALPPVSCERVERRLQDALRPHVVLAAEIIHVVAHERRDVLRP